MFGDTYKVWPLFTEVNDCGCLGMHSVYWVNANVWDIQIIELG